jgi:hypothetical protein
MIGQHTGVPVDVDQWGAGRAHDGLSMMAGKPLDLPMAVAKNFVRDMRAYFAEPNAIKRDEIAARQLHALRQHQGSVLRSPGIIEAALTGNRCPNAFDFIVRFGAGLLWGARALRLWLRITDGLGQHLAQLELHRAMSFEGNPEDICYSLTHKRHRRR